MLLLLLLLPLSWLLLQPRLALSWLLQSLLV